MDAGDEDASTRVLILLPIGRDASLAQEALTRSGFSCRTCADVDELGCEIHRGAGACLIGEEALGATANAEEWIGPEPAWSQLPLVVLFSAGSSSVNPATLRPLERRTNASFLQRPVPKRTLISILRGAIEGRSRQYVVRDLLTERERVEQTLRDSEGRLRMSLEAGEMGVWEWDMKGGRDFWDARQHEHYGFTQGDGDAPIGRAFVRLVHPDDRQRVQHAVDAAIGACKDYQQEFRIVRPDGEIRWLAARGRCVRDERGELIKIGGITWDVTEQTERARQLRLLMQEVDHRAKNLLAVVQSIARQTSRESPPEDFVGDLVGRLQGLSASQDLIIRGNWRSVNLQELIRSQLDHLTGVAAERVRIVGEPLLVAPPAAQSIGMAMHELATNAAKYGALSNNAGEISIEWSHDTNGAGLFCISWTERGGPPVAPPSHRGFGHTVIERMAAYGVNGEVELSYEPTGFRWKLEAPEEHVLYRNDIRS